MNVLAIDIGGTNINILATGQTERRKFPLGDTLTPKAMVEGVMEQAKDWTYETVFIAYKESSKRGNRYKASFN